MEDNFRSAIRFNEGINFSTIMNKVFSKMFIGLFVTAIAAYITYTSGVYVTILSNTFLSIGIAIAEFALVIYLSSRILKMDAMKANFWFYAYAVLNGITMAYIFAMFRSQTIFLAFACSAAMFGITALYGYITKKDLSTVGSVGLMLLVGVIITTLLNTFLFKSVGVDLFLLYAGLVIFAGLTAYDMQQIKQITAMVDEGQKDLAECVSIMGALTIYMDFINIFIRLLSIFGRNDDNQ